jgi:membrane protein
VNVFTRIGDTFDRVIASARRRSGVFDNAWQAQERYGEVLGGRLAAANAYYGFFAAFALGLVGYSILGFMLERNLDLAAEVDQFLRDNLPFLDIAAVQQSRGTVGLLGLAALVFAGVGWVETLRSSQRLIWQLEQQPGNPVVRRLVDLGMLIGLGVLLTASVAAASGIEWLVAEMTPVGRSVTTWVLAVGVNTVLAVALLGAVPRLRISPRRLLPAAVLVVAGITVLNSLGGAYIDRVQGNGAYAVVATAAGVLVYLYLFHQLLLFAAAVAATNPHGRMVDLAAGSPPDGAGEVSRPAEPAATASGTGAAGGGG